MAVKIKLTRLGKIRNPQYRVIVADARTRRDGRSIETIGLYVVAPIALFVVITGPVMVLDKSKKQV